MFRRQKIPLNVMLRNTSITSLSKNKKEIANEKERERRRRRKKCCRKWLKRLSSVYQFETTIWNCYAWNYYAQGKHVRKFLKSLSKCLLNLVCLWSRAYLTKNEKTETFVVTILSNYCKCNSCFCFLWKANKGITGNLWQHL